MKHCNRCDTDLPRENFYTLKNNNGHRLSAYCKICSTQYKIEWKAKNPDKTKLINKKTTLKSRYGMSLEEFEERLLSQNSSCAICSKDISEFNEAFVDHNHKTGKVRKLLCRHCNTGLGHFQDNKEVLLLAIKYLEENS